MIPVADEEGDDNTVTMYVAAQGDPNIRNIEGDYDGMPMTVRLRYGKPVHALPPARRPRSPISRTTGYCGTSDVTTSSDAEAFLSNSCYILVRPGADIDGGHGHGDRCRAGAKRNV
nr:hypothetical protein OG781_22510 [Streptomyces sp. NBC_00830]